MLIQLSLLLASVDLLSRLPTVQGNSVQKIGEMEKILKLPHFHFKFSSQSMKVSDNA